MIIAARGDHNLDIMNKFMILGRFIDVNTDVFGMFAVCWVLYEYSSSPGEVHIFGVQNLQWQSLFGPVQRKVVQSGGEERVTAGLLTW